MALVGDGLLAIWHDIAEGAFADFTEWHTREHMPERVAIPGFTLGKRLMNNDLPRHRIGTLYAADSVETFGSDAYLARLNDPTDWTLRVQPAFRNFLRVACIRIASAGQGDGGALATVRLSFADQDGPRILRDDARRLANALLDLSGVCCAHVLLARPEVSTIRTRETELRPEMREQGFDALIVVEGSGRDLLAAALPRIREVATSGSGGFECVFAEVYDLAYHLSAPASVRSTG